MKKITSLFLLAVLIISFGSCKKSADPAASGGYYFKAKFDGSSKDFSTSVAAFKSNEGSGMYNLTITGITPTEEGAITLWSDKDDFTTGKTFTISALNGSTYNLLTYSAPFGSSDPNSQWVSTYNYGTVPESFQCTITEATSSYIKGSFSSVIYQNSDNAVAKKTVTEGQFYAKF